MKRKIFSAALALLTVALALCACGGNKPEETAPATSAEAALEETLPAESEAATEAATEPEQTAPAVTEAATEPEQTAPAATEAVTEAATEPVRTEEATVTPAPLPPTPAFSEGSELPIDYIG